MLALYEYQTILWQLQKEIKGSKGWLRPIHLQELAGTPASDILKQAIEEDKEEVKKREREKD